MQLWQAVDGVCEIASAGVRRLLLTAIPLVIGLLTVQTKIGAQVHHLQPLFPQDSDDLG